MFLRLKHLQYFANKLAIKLKASFLTKQEGIDGIILEQDWQLVDTVTADTAITLPSVDTIEDIYIEMYTTDGTIIHQSSIKKDSLLFTSTNTTYREILLDSILDAQTYVTYYLDTNAIKATCCEGTDITSESTSVTTKVYVRKISEVAGSVNASRVTYGDSTVAASISTLSSKVDTNTTDINSIKIAMVEKTTYEAHVEEFNTLESTVETVSGKVDTLTTNTSTLSSNVAGIAENVSTLSSNVEANSTEITALKNNISGMSSGPIGVFKGINYNINKINLDCDKIWSSVSALPYDFVDSGAILLNNEIHILGSGYYSNSIYTYSKYHYKYNISTNTWSNVSTLPYDFYAGSAIVLDNEIHILGGNGSGSYRKYHYKYNTSTNTWSKVSTLPYDFYYGNAIVLNNEIHILGGNSSGKYHYKYNSSNNTWSSVSTLPYDFYSGNAILLNNEIHILSSSANTSCFKYHYKYNISTNTWSSVSTLPGEVYYGKAVVLDNEIHILGGNYYNNYLTSHYKYNTSTDTWSSVSTLPYNFYNGGAVVLNNEIHILGSSYSGSYTKHYKYGNNLSTGSIKSVELTDGTNTFVLTMKTS